MNTSQIKAYAPKARKDFIRAVTSRANLLGISNEKIEPVEIKGDIALIDGRPFPKSIAKLRQNIANKVNADGFDQVMESVAYTWFNRFVALRYMELHDYLDHGYRVLSNPSGTDTPEIMEKASDIDLPGLNKDKVIELRLAGNKDNELYRMLIVAQCNAMHNAMPFLFEHIYDETELLLPDNLLHSNSPVRKLVNEIDEELWNEVEIIGWIYQFYISEKKDQVIGKVVKSEDIPAATQLFTPNWIVKYMVQNTLGRMWLATYPESTLKEKMEYYIEPAKQEPEAQKQLDAIITNELNPEEITFLDPACGSGHILVEAYNLLKEIYLERGHRTRDIPRLILEKNLYGIDIDDRAAQLAGFALLMKARQDNRRFFEREDIKHNVISIKSSDDLDVENVFNALSQKKISPLVMDQEVLPGFAKQEVLSVKQSIKVQKSDIVEFVNKFKYAKTFGSLISFSEGMSEKLVSIKNVINKIIAENPIFTSLCESLLDLIKQATFLSRRYDCVVTNPPYMGAKYMNSIAKDFAKSNFPDSKSDIFAMFVKKSFTLTTKFGYNGFVTPYVWMFISSYEKFRNTIETKSTLVSLIQLEYNAFEPACVPVATYTLHNYTNPHYKGDFIKLSDFKGHQNQAPKTLEAIKDIKCSYRHIASSNDFKKIPGSPIAYWVSDRVRNCFVHFTPLSSIAETRQGLATGDNDRFLRMWYEVDFSKIGIDFDSEDEFSAKNMKWCPCHKGGGFRKWYGNNDFVVNWENNGSELINFQGSVIRNKNYYFKEGLTWSSLTSSLFAMRYSTKGYIFETKGAMCFPYDSDDIEYLIGLFNSKILNIFILAISPTLDYHEGPVGKIPVKKGDKSVVKRNSNCVISIAKYDWDSFETSWDFKHLPLLSEYIKTTNTKESYLNWQKHCNNNIARMIELEEENNRIFIEAYGLQDELTPKVLEDQITLARADQEKDIKRLISYSIGCMMGRYSLDESGLIYANSENNGFDHSRYKTFPADDDGIVPVMDIDWFPDDATNRFVKFLQVAWTEDRLEENLEFVAKSIGQKGTESAMDSIRRYISTGFFKDHLKTYKKRPIYWLFSSGKQKAFECLVYLHRYNESTLARMRSEYVTPLQGKLNARMEHLRNEIEAATTSSAKKKLEKQLEQFKKKHEELTKFDDELRHYADMRIKLDLDDGVKVNYGKFGNLLAEKNAVVGKAKK